MSDCLYKMDILCIISSDFFCSSQPLMYLYVWWICHTSRCVKGRAGWVFEASEHRPCCPPAREKRTHHRSAAGCLRCHWWHAHLSWCPLLVTTTDASHTSKPVAHLTRPHLHNHSSTMQCLCFPRHGLTFPNLATRWLLLRKLLWCSVWFTCLNRWML